MQSGYKRYLIVLLHRIKMAGQLWKTCKYAEPSVNVLIGNLMCEYGCTNPNVIATGKYEICTDSMGDIATLHTNRFLHPEKDAERLRKATEKALEVCHECLYYETKR